MPTRRFLVELGRLTDGNDWLMWILTMCVMGNSDTEVFSISTEHYIDIKAVTVVIQTDRYQFADQ